MANQYTSVPWPDRFWAKVDKCGPDECWEWTAHRVGGYGSIRVGAPPHSRMMGAHRVAFELTHGVTAPSRLEVCHHCDNPPCVNPAHLFLGTHADNMRDRNIKKRDKPPSPPKLTPEQVVDIRRRYAAREGSQSQLGREYGVAQAHISRIVSREFWKYAEEDAV